MEFTDDEWAQGQYEEQQAQLYAERVARLKAPEYVFATCAETLTIKIDDYTKDTLLIRSKVANEEDHEYFLNADEVFTLIDFLTEKYRLMIYK